MCHCASLVGVGVVSECVGVDVRVGVHRYLHVCVCVPVPGGWVGVDVRVCACVCVSICVPECLCVCLLSYSTQAYHVHAMDSTMCISFLSIRTHTCSTLHDIHFVIK